MTKSKELRALKYATIDVRRVLEVAGSFPGTGAQAIRLRNELAARGRESTRQVSAAVAKVVNGTRRRNDDMRRRVVRELGHIVGGLAHHDAAGDSEGVTDAPAAADELDAIARELDDIQQTLASETNARAPRPGARQTSPPPTNE